LQRKSRSIYDVALASPVHTNDILFWTQTLESILHCGPIFRFAPGVSLQYQFQGLAPSREIQITLAGAPLTATDDTTLQTNLNAMSGAPVVLISGGTLPAL
jgi:hypothetical protein